MVIKKYIHFIGNGIIKIYASYDDQEECKKVNKEIEELDFKNIQREKKIKNKEYPKRVTGEWLYSNDYSRDKKLNELLDNNWELKRMSN